MEVSQIFGRDFLAWNESHQKKVSSDSQPGVFSVLLKQITPCPIINAHEKLSFSPLQLRCESIVLLFSLVVWRLNKLYFCTPCLLQLRLCCFFFLLWTRKIGPVGKVDLGKRRKQMISWYTLRTKMDWKVRRESLLKKSIPKKPSLSTFSPAWTCCVHQCSSFSFYSGSCEVCQPFCGNYFNSLKSKHLPEKWLVLQNQGLLKHFKENSCFIL